MSSRDLNKLLERLVGLLGREDFLTMKGLANEVPLFIQTYDPMQEDALRRMVDSLATRLRSAGITVTTIDLFELVLEEMDERGILDDLLESEATFEKAELLETLQNFSDPSARVVPRLVRGMGGEDTRLTLITGSGRVYPFLRTHSVLEALQPAMPRHPVVFFFPGEYTQDSDGGSHMRLFGKAPSQAISNPYYRAMNLDHYAIRAAK